MEKCPKSKSMRDSHHLDGSPCIESRDVDDHAVEHNSELDRLQENDRVIDLDRLLLPHLLGICTLFLPRIFTEAHISGVYTGPEINVCKT